MRPQKKKTYGRPRITALVDSELRVWEYRVRDRETGALLGVGRTKREALRAAGVR